MGEKLKHLIPKRYHKMLDMDWVEDVSDDPAKGTWTLTTADGFCFCEEGKHTMWVVMNGDPDREALEMTLKEALHNIFPCNCKYCNEETHDKAMRELNQSMIDDGLLPSEEEMLARSKACATQYSAEERLTIILNFIHEARRISQENGCSIEVAVEGKDDSLDITEFDNRKKPPSVINSEMVIFGRAWTEKHLEKARNILKHCAKSNGLQE